MIKIKEDVYIDREAVEIVYTENNEVVKRVPIPIELNTLEYTSEYGHYGENNPPLPFTPVGDKEYDV